MKSTCKALCVLGACGWPLMASAQLAATAWPPNGMGQKTVVPLAMKSGLTEQISLARAVAFLLDEHGKVVGQTTRWVIGGGDDKGLAVGATNAFFFPIAADKPLPSINLSARVAFTRVVLQSVNLADVAKDVIVKPAKR